MLIESENPAAAIEHYRQALKLQPANLSAQNNLAWLLATTPTSSPSEHAEAVQLATRAKTLTRGASASVLDTLGTALSAAGDKRAALSSWQDALKVAEREKNLQLVRQLRASIDQLNK